MFASALSLYQNIDLRIYKSFRYILMIFIANQADYLTKTAPIKERSNQSVGGDKLCTLTRKFARIHKDFIFSNSVVPKMVVGLLTER